jgi:gentisate 1,2-dioxygenase
MLLLLVNPTAHQFQMEGLVFRLMAAEQGAKPGDTTKSGSRNKSSCYLHKGRGEGVFVTAWLMVWVIIVHGRI